MHLMVFDPNSNSITNWAFIYLFDLIIQGKILFDNKTDAKWTNHDYVINITR